VKIYSVTLIIDSVIAVEDDEDPDEVLEEVKYDIINNEELTLQRVNSELTKEMFEKASIKLPTGWSLKTVPWSLNENDTRSLKEIFDDNSDCDASD
jgi:hypothetical protein